MKMNAFQQAVSQMWQCKDFLEEAVIDGNVVNVVCSKIVDQIAWNDVGAENTTDFVLYVQVGDIQKPKINSKVKFRGDTYKVSYSELDSAGTSYKLFLVETTTGIK